MTDSGTNALCRSFYRVRRRDMFCKYCGNQLKDDAFVCMQCGCETGLHQRALSHAHADKPSVFDAFLYFSFGSSASARTSRTEKPPPIRVLLPGRIGSGRNFLCRRIFGDDSFLPDLGPRNLLTSGRKAMIGKGTPPQAVCPFSVPVKDLTVPVRRAGFCPYLRYNISFPRSTAYFTV